METRVRSCRVTYSKASFFSLSFDIMRFMLYWTPLTTTPSLLHYYFLFLKAGYSSRVAYSALKGRAAVAVDTCGGCGTKGASGSASQRAALILSDGPPIATDPGDEVAEPLVGMLEFTGDSDSHNFPSIAQVNIEVTPTADANIIMVALSSSDGSGGTSNATFAGNGKWIVQQPIFMGTGWGASSDPFTLLNQQRTLIISPDLSSATYQDMGSDFTVNSISILQENEGEDDTNDSTVDETSGAWDGSALSSCASFYWGYLTFLACGAVYLVF